MLREEDVRSELEMRRLGAWIHKTQRGDGYLPWNGAGHADPWNMIEAAMGLDVAGSHAAAEATYHWLAAAQPTDGSWFAGYQDGTPDNRSRDANFSAYIATGLWHHYLFTRDVPFLDEMWPTIRRAFDFVLDLQAASGEIYWARDERGRPWTEALVTSSSCVALSLRCGIAIAELLDRDRPDWELSLAQLEASVAAGGGKFLDKRRYSMDWYYPVLGGVLHDETARARLRDRWDEFVVDGLGARCVADRPWITTGETCELVIACILAGLDREAAELFDAIHRLGDDDGGYWTGATFPDGRVWPVEKTTWNVGAVLLAADCLNGGPTLSLFDGSSMLRRSQPIADAR